MKIIPISTPNCTFEATATRALYWPDERLIVVSDLHLGKSERISRRSGHMLPPYETKDTLNRLTEVIQHFDPRRVICLGDSFDDTQAAQNLDRLTFDQIEQLMSGRDWVWIEGNHDPSPTQLGGQAIEELKIGANIFRHIAKTDAKRYEISGHYHPKVQLVLKRNAITRPCFVFDGKRLIMPSFGTYTGGLSCSDPAISSLLGRDAKAVLTGTTPHLIPMPR